MEKTFIGPEEMRNAAFRLAAKIWAAKFYPNVIYIALRGGADLGNPISEFFKWVRQRHPELHRVLFAAVTARSYTGVRERGKVRIEGWTYDPQHLRAGDKVLLVDDIFDHGHTINHLVDVIMDKGIPRDDIKVAVHDYKIRTFEAPLPVQPDYWCRKYEITNPEEDPWLHYLSHELEELTEAEMLEHLCPDDPELARMLLSV